MDINPYTFFKDDDVFVLWQWSWLIIIPAHHHYQSQTDAKATSDSDDDDIPVITHTVIFKCIGAHKETEYQDQLELAKKNLKDGNSVAVKLNPEPDNRCNSKAI